MKSGRTRQLQQKQIICPGRLRPTGRSRPPFLNSPSLYHKIDYLRMDIVLILDINYQKQSYFGHL